jgi:hypothetical protein
MPPSTMKAPATRLTMRLQRGSVSNAIGEPARTESYWRNVSQRAGGTDNASEKSMMGDWDV